MCLSDEKAQSDSPQRLERARERETIRHYETWLESRRGYLSPKNLSRHQPPKHGSDNVVIRDEATWKISRDKALVAFAQLGCLRLNAKRGLVTLITTTHAYILAEATKTVSLLSGGQHADGDELWFGTASIPRSQGISEHVLNAQPFTAKSPDGQEYTAPALVLDDITQDSRFRTRGYAGKGVTFYAGVPIVNENGFTIGTFSVTDDKPRRGGLTSEELQFMQDIASTIMDHLENIRNDTARHRGERLVLGLGAFTEGHTSLDLDTDNPTHSDGKSDDSHNETVVRSTFKGLTISNTGPTAPLPTPSKKERSSSMDGRTLETSPRDIDQAQSTTTDSATAVKGSLKSSNLQNAVNGVEADNGKASAEAVSHDISSHSLEYSGTFSRAANILRQCTDTDGVMFFDVSSASIGDVHQGFFGVRRTHSNDSTTSSDDAYYSSGGSSDDLAESLSSNVGRFDGKHEAHPASSRRASQTKNCELLGHSFRKSHKTQLSHIELKEVEMRRFLRKYPKGMVIHFTEDGDVSSSEEGSARDRARSDKSSVLSDKKRAIARGLIKVVPGARNVIWLPLWDFLRSRWAAGCFIWTSRPGRLLNAQEDLIYIKAFASTIMNEINRLEAIASDRAKTTFAANISHELRSPLHGILGSIEFLQDTAIDAFQASMITTVETCGKTLLDTLNHVLDFAKFSKQPKQQRRRLGNLAPTSLGSEEKEKVDLAKLVEEVIESIFAGQTFRSTGAFHTTKEDEDAGALSDQERSPVRNLAGRTQSKFSGAIQLIFDVEKLDNWIVYAKPGAIRRIVMNLFGNALKYTERGMVCVSLSSNGNTFRDDSNLKFCMSVADTGKGMSAEFIKHHAWKPFSQEDSFASGVGLGLSIVQQITDSLGGHTTLQSSKDKGTVASVTLTLPRALQLDEGSESVSAVAQRVSGLKLCVLKPNTKRLYGIYDEANAKAEDVFTNMASSWFGLQVLSSKDIKSSTADFYLYMEPPPTEYLFEEHGFGPANMDIPLIVITPNAFESATLRRDTQKIKDLGRILEIISQPIGPAKFAMTIERCLDRKHSCGLPDVTSPWPLDGKSTYDTPQSADMDNKFQFATRERASLQHKGQPEASDQCSTRSPPELSSPRSDNQSDTMTASLDTQVLSDSGTGPQSSFTTSNSEDIEGRGPVLLVDDNQVNLKLLVAFVHKAKYTYKTALNGLEALNMYKEASSDPKHAFKTVVMDIQMPVMDGITATREIRDFESKSCADRPAFIIALTGLASESTSKECVKAGMDHFLSKPVKFRDFLNLLSQR